MTNYIEIDGIRVAYSIAGSGPPILFVHGYCCNRLQFENQTKFFSRSFRTISLDLPWHGESGMDGAISIEYFARVCGELLSALAVGPTLLVGHSMGGFVVGQLANSNPQAAAGVVALDSGYVPRPDLLPSLGELAEVLRSESYRPAFKQFVQERLFQSAEGDPWKSRIVGTMVDAPHRLVFEGQIAMTEFMRDQSERVLADIEGPVAIISSTNPFSDLERVKQINPRVIFAQVLGSGHFIHCFVPDQVNAMILRFWNLQHVDVAAKGI